MGFRYQGLGFRVQGLGFRMQGLGFRIRGFARSDCGIYSFRGSGFEVSTPSLPMPLLHA